MRLSAFLERRRRALQAIDVAIAPLVALTVPVRIKGTTNGSQGVTLGGRRFRRDKQRGLRSIGHNAAKALGLKALLAQHGALVIHLVRIAPNRLDGDNLEASFKRVRDGLARAVGVDDRHPSVEYVADDERGAVRQYAVRVEVFPQITAAAEVPHQHAAQNAQLAEAIIGTYKTPLDFSPTPNVRRSR